MTKTTDDDHCFWILSALETMDPEDPEHVDEVVSDCLAWAREGHILAQQRAAVRGTWTVSLPEVSEEETAAMALPAAENRSGLGGTRRGQPTRSRFVKPPTRRR